MCYLCYVSTNTFGPRERETPIQKKRERAAEIKRALREVEKEGTCPFGDNIAKVLRDEQYRLSREL